MFPIHTYTISRDDSIYEAFPDVTLTADVGATLSATYTDTSGRRTDLLSYTEKDARRTRHIVSRVMTPSDRGGYIILSGSGALTVHEVSVTALESNS